MTEIEDPSQIEGFLGRMGIVNRLVGKLGATAISALVLVLWTNVASAAPMSIHIVNVSAVTNNELNPVTILTDSTDTVLIEVIGIADGGLYDAWSAWDTSSGCDSGVPSMCTQGWLWSATVFVNGDPSLSGVIFAPGLFADPLDALAAAKAENPPGPGTTGFGSYSFFTGETISFEDNRGGVSLRLTINPVPIPAAAWLFGSALLGLVGVKRKKA